MVTTYGVYTVDIGYFHTVNRDALVNFNKTLIADDVANKVSIQCTHTAQAGKAAIAQAMAQLQ